MRYAIVCLCLEAALTVAVYGQESFPFAGVITADRVHLRGGGSVNHAILHTARRGELVAVHGVGGSRNAWYRIRYPRPLLAYIVTRYVRRVRPDLGILEANRVNLRPTPSLKRAPITQLRTGTRLHILGEKNGFYEVIIPEDVFVWIKRDYVRPLGPLAAYAEKLAALRQRALAEFLGLKKKAAPPAPKKEAAKAVARKPALRLDAAAQRRAQRLERLRALEAEWGRLGGAAKTAPLEAFLKKLEGFDREAAAARDAYARFKVNQLITQVRLRLVELRTAAAARRKAQAEFPRPEGGIVTYTGWLKRDVEPLAGRVFFKLVKGDVVLYELRTERYDLSRFVDRHVAVTGRVRPRRGPMERPVLEVTRLKVLAQ